MQLTANDPRLAVDPDQVAMIAIVEQPGREIAIGRGVNRLSGRRMTPLMKVTPATMDQLRAEPEYRGNPVYWSAREGFVEVWPTPAHDFVIQVRSRDGRTAGLVTKPVQTVPVASYITAIARAHQDQTKRMGEPERVERFSLLGEE